MEIPMNKIYLTPEELKEKFKNMFDENGHRINPPVVHNFSEMENDPSWEKTTSTVDLKGKF